MNFPYYTRDGSVVNILHCTCASSSGVTRRYKELKMSALWTLISYESLHLWQVKFYNRTHWKGDFCQFCVVGGGSSGALIVNTFVWAWLEILIVLSLQNLTAVFPVTVADLGGAPPPRPKIFSIACSFSENLTKSYVGAPLEGRRPLLQGILDPPLSNAVVRCNRTRWREFFASIQTYNFVQIAD